MECRRHISGWENPADLPSRGANPIELLDSRLWCDGPEVPVDEIPETGETDESMPLLCAEELRADERKKLTAS